MCIRMNRLQNRFIIGSCAAVAQWQSRSFPSLRRGFDSRLPLHFCHCPQSMPWPASVPETPARHATRLPSSASIECTCPQNGEKTVLGHVFCFLKQEKRFYWRFLPWRNTNKIWTWLYRIDKMRAVTLGSSLLRLHEALMSTYSALPAVV